MSGTAWWPTRVGIGAGMTRSSSPGIPGAPHLYAISTAAVHLHLVIIPASHYFVVHLSIALLNSRINFLD